MNTMRRNRVELFTLQDLEVFYPKTRLKTIKNNLRNWLLKGYIKRLKRNLYMNVQVYEKNIPCYYMANKLYEQSYVSLETALSFYNIIPEEVSEITSVTTKPTRTIKNEYGVFIYRTCKKNAFYGYNIMKIEMYKTFIADREKALVDFVYYRIIDGQTDFSEERFNEKLLPKLNSKKAEMYAEKFNKKTLETIKQIL